MAKSAGTFLEEHGNRLRVVVNVPPSLHAALGKKKLKESLPAGTTRRQADTLKWPVVDRFKRLLRDASKQATPADLLVEAAEMRAAIAAGEYRNIVDRTDAAGEALPRRYEAIEGQKGTAAAEAFLSVVTGRAHPLRCKLADHLERGGFSAGYVQDTERAIARLEGWCRTAKVPATIEALTTVRAGDFVHAVYVSAKVHHKTANKDISALSSYWRYLKKRLDFVTANPWNDQRLSAPSRRHGPAAIPKRPFTRHEVEFLLSAIDEDEAGDRRLLHFMTIAALSGMRLNEIANLRASDCKDGWFVIRSSKTDAGVRSVPQHSRLRGVVKSLLQEVRHRNAPLDAYLFDLPDQKAGSKRDRGACVTQAFTRFRRAAGVDERASDQRQSAVDFHSFRRTFVRQALDALAAGAAGFFVQTIAEIIGHEVEDGRLEGVAIPNGLTVGRYGGSSPAKMLEACIEAVQMVPSAASGTDESPAVRARLAAIKARGQAASDKHWTERFPALSAGTTKDAPQKLPPTAAT